MDPLGADALALPALDRLVEVEDRRPGRPEGIQQQAEQDACRCPPAQGGTVENAMVIGEPPLPAEPHDPENVGHRALPWHQHGPDQQNVSMPPTPLREERREA
jgi:hypothetical protein